MKRKIASFKLISTTNEGCFLEFNPSKDGQVAEKQTLFIARSQTLNVMAGAKAE